MATCYLQNETCVACYNAGNFETTVTATAQIFRPLADVARALDPRAWASCPGVFLKTQLVEENVDPGDITIHTRYREDTRLTRALGEKWPNPPTAEPWKIYEEVEAGPFRFENVLSIVSPPQRTPTHYEYAYDFVECFPVLGNAYLTKDRGSVKATESVVGTSKVTTLTMVKTIEFANTASIVVNGVDLGELPNWLAPAVLGMWLDAGNDLLCCTPP